MISKSKQDVISELDGVNIALKKLQASIKASNITVVSKKETKNEVQRISGIWFEQLKNDLLGLGLDNSKIKIVNEGFDKLLKLSSTNSRKTSYLECLKDLVSNIEKNLKIDIMKLSVTSNKVLNLATFAKNATANEIEYLTEAVNCANSGYRRASVVLGWSAAIARIHKIIEKKGFDDFNTKSVEMKNKTKGRYKRFKKTFDVGTLAELQTVFDTDILWILEYWGLIDTNEHDRLEICFTMRNNAAHPGEAPITEENLLSFYSDLKTMIFDNDEFQIKIA